MTIDTASPLPGAGHAPINTSGSIRVAPTLRGSVTSSHGLSMEQLVAIKFAADESTLYANHGFAKGGVGYVVATGAARAGISRLPQTAHKSSRGGSSVGGSVRAMSASAGYGSRATSAATGHQQGQPFSSTTFSASGLVSNAGAATINGSETILSEAAGSSPISAKEWEKGASHAYDFTAATRRTRVHDMTVTKSGRFSGISFYENDPAEIKRHLDIVNALDQLHAASKAEERHVERARHATWAAKQRATFRRQRQELARRYQMGGLPDRPTYAWANASVDSAALNWELGRPSTVGTSYRPDTVGTVGSGTDSMLGMPGPGFPGSRAVTAGSNSTQGGGRRASFSEGSSVGQTHSFLASFAPGSEVAGSMAAAPRPIPLPKPTFMKIYDRMGAEIADSPRLKAEAWRQAQAAKAQQKEEAIIQEELKELEGFDNHLLHIARLKSRSQYVSGNSHAHGAADDD